MFQYNRNLLHLEPEVITPTPTPTYTPGIYWSQSLGLISISSDGITWYTITDKNLGATTVWNPGDAYTIANTGNVFQWGNNYAFPSPLDSTPITTSTSQVDVSTYGPDNYYYDSTFRTGYIWMTAMNEDLWGETTGTDAARQGPCASGFHIPSKNEFENLVNKWAAVRQYIYTGMFFVEDFKVTTQGGRNANGSASTSTTTAGYWTTSLFSNYYGRYTSISTNGGAPGTNAYQYTTFGAYIRPFKNTPVTPDSTWTVLFQPSS